MDTIIKTVVRKTVRKDTHMYVPIKTVNVNKFLPITKKKVWCILIEKKKTLLVERVEENLLPIFRS